MDDAATNVWRLLISPAASGAANMALDEAILEAVAASESPPTLRLYAWQPACLSLGYAQGIKEVDQERLRLSGFDIVRRMTGGRAILHIDELTYSIAGLTSIRPLSGSILSSYRNLSRGLIAGLTSLGIPAEIQPEIKLPEGARSNPVCFEVPSSYEITVSGKKLIGSAQVRRKGALLQHGAIPLKGDISRICQVLRFEDQSHRQRAMSRLLNRATTVESILGQAVSWENAALAMAEGFRSALDLPLEAGEVSSSEKARTNRLIIERYGNRSWTERV